MSVIGMPVASELRSCSSLRRAWNAPGVAIGLNVGLGTPVLATPIIVVPNTMYRRLPSVTQRTYCLTSRSAYRRKASSAS
jgi:hypothetical protein